jgi:hypothetical protein
MKANISKIFPTIMIRDPKTDSADLLKPCHCGSQTNLMNEKSQREPKQFEKSVFKLEIKHRHTSCNKVKVNYLTYNTY